MPIDRAKLKPKIGEMRKYFLLWYRNYNAGQTAVMGLAPGIPENFGVVSITHFNSIT